jgi:hypothetical protein
MEELENALKPLVLIVTAVFVTILFAWPVQLLWNWALAPAIDSVHPITFWQALGINLLATILFKSSSVKTND